jgi:hypothetical protein
MTEKQSLEIVQAIQELTEAVENLTYNLKGDGGHTIGDSLEGIMLQLLKEKK